MVRILFVFVLVSIGGKAYCQEIPTLLNIPNAVSPQAYEFTKYGDVPVSKYTGVPQITIPIYTIETDGLKIPISLSYHSNGIKVKEEASWVGLGWTLRAEGSIVQVVNEYDDFSGKISRGVVNPDNFDIPGGSVNDCLGFSVEYSQEIDTGIHPHTLINLDDSEPDVFSFNFLNYSGEFIYDRYSDDFISLDNSNIKVTSDYHSSGLSYPQYFTITVPEGHKFHFQLKTKTVVTSSYGYNYDSNGNGGGNSQIVELEGEAVSRLYQLATVYTNLGEEINFAYQQSQEVINVPSVSKSITSYEYDESSIHNMGPESHLFPLNKTAVNFLATSQTNSYPSFIEAGNVRIEFQSADDRTDLVNSHKLNAINIRNKFTNALITSFDFEYDYFIGHLNGNNIDYYLEQHLNMNKSDNEKLQRLKLISVTEKGKPAYSFTYSPVQLPSKTSLAYDHWGFYNGKLTSYLLSRNGSDINYIRAALLQSITYPTGGKTEFEYELNELSDEEVVTSNYQDEQGGIYLYDNNYNNPYPDSYGEFIYKPSDNYVWLLVPDVGATITISKGLSVTGPCSDLWPVNEPTYPNTFWEIRRYNADAKDMVEEIGWGAIPNFVENDDYKEATVREEINTGEPLSQFWPTATQRLAPGVYLFSVGLNNECGAQNSVGEGGFASIVLDYTTKKLVSQELAKPKGAGLRVKNIKDLLSETQTSKVTKYEYSGAVLMSTPEYEHEEPYKYEYEIKHYDLTGDYLGADLYAILALATTSYSSPFNTPSTNASGKYVGYGMVKESILDSDNSPTNGSIVYRFQNEADSKHPSGGNFPLRESLLENGSISTQTYLGVSGDTIKHLEYNYFHSSLPCLLGWKTYWQKRQLFQYIQETFIYENIYKVGFYPISRHQTFLESQKIVEYDGLRRKESLVTYDYDSYNQMSGKDYINSNNKHYQILYKYPYDFSDAISSSMIEENHIATILEERLSVNDNIVKQVKREYEEVENIITYGNHKFFITSEILKKNITTSEFESEIEYQLFDKEKLLQYVTKEGITTSLVWGYNRQYLVAKIVGASYSEVTALVNMNLINNPSSDEQLRVELDKIRSGLPHAVVTSYTYKPLVGMTSETDPNGRIKLFDYNSQNLLKVISDGDGNLLDYFQYNFFKRN